MDNLVEVFQNPLQFNVLMLVAAFIGGVIASISPCSLAMLPIIIGYVGGYSKESNFRIVIQVLSFIFGMSVVFSLIGIICALTGKVLGSFTGGYFSILIASIILIMGLKLMNILDFEFPVIVKRLPSNDGSKNFIYPFLLGMVFALAGSPCSTPILASIMAFASYSENIVISVVMLFLFSFGQGVILILAAIFTSGLKQMKQFSKISDIILKLCGLLLVIVAIFLYYKSFHSFF